MMSKSAFGDCRFGAGVLLVVCLSIMLAPSLMAQTSATGALTGTIKDPSGAVVPNATVTVWACEPTSRLRSKTAVSVTLTTAEGISTGLNPPASILTR